MKKITLISELIGGRKYQIDGEGPYEYAGRAEQNQTHVFKFEDRFATFAGSSIEKLILAGTVFELENSAFDSVTVPEYQHLDVFTQSVFQDTPVRSLFESMNILSEFSRTDLLILDDLCRDLKLTYLPADPSDPTAEALVKDPRWPLFNKYLRKLVPTITTPDELG